MRGNRRSTSSRSKIWLSAAAMLAVAMLATGSAQADGGLPDGFVPLATPFKLTSNQTMAAHAVLDKVATGGTTTVPTYASSVYLTLSVKSGKAAGHLLVYPTGNPDTVVDLSWTAGQSVTATTVAQVGLKNSVRFDNQSAGSVIVTSTIAGYAGGGAQGPKGDPGPAGGTGISIRLITDTATTQTLATYNGWTFAAVCNPTNGTTNTALGIYVTPPSGVFFNTRGTNPWLEDSAGATGTQALGLNSASGTTLIAGNTVTAGHLRNQWSSPAIVSGSDGTTFALTYNFTISAQPTVLPHDCDLEGVIIPAQ